MFAKILVPEDYNDLAQRPLEIGIELARAGGGRVVLFSVVAVSLKNPDIMSFQLPWADYHRHLRDAAVTRLEDLKRRLGGGDTVEICVVRGQPARKIVEFAEAEGCDLIVMATHGPSALHHALVGSVTRKVLHHTTCPVMVVRQPQPRA